MNNLFVRLTICGILLALLVPACARQPQPARVEEITFHSESFNVVGDLRLPGGTAPFPVILFVHGSGPAELTGSGSYLPIMERMLHAGYATFAWDKPGTGESTGTIDEQRLIQQRAQIILDAIEVLKRRSDIDPEQVGLWGESQAGYVMPHALSLSDDIAFLICVSCPGAPGNDQMAFQIATLGLCESLPEDKADQRASLLAELSRTQTYETYEEYLHYRQVLLAVAELASASLDPYPVLSEQAWRENAPVNRATWNPVEVIEQANIPVLAIFGDKDRQMDPVQGAHAYRKALEQAGNPQSRVELFAGANHAILVSESGCPKDQLEQLEQYVRSLGFVSLQEAQEAFLANPDDPWMLEAYPFAPGFLDLIEEWLRNLRDDR